MKDWFEGLMGFAVRSTEQVHTNLSLDGTELASKVNGRKFGCSKLKLATVSELHQKLESCDLHLAEFRFPKSRCCLRSHGSSEPA